MIYSLGLFLYLVVASPFYLLRIARGRYRSSVLQRLGRDLPPAPEGETIWIHACSVGEAEAARPVIEALRMRRPNVSLIVSTVTETGQDRSRKLYPYASVRYLPFDFLSCVRRHLAAAGNLSAFIIMETEIWPNLIRELHRRGIPIFISNGRISDRAWPRYSGFALIFRPILALVSAVAARSDTDAERFRFIGAHRVETAGNVKFDREPAPVPANAPTGRVLLFGSTHKGEEEICLEVFRRLKKDFPDLRAIIAPRHTERAAEVARLAPMKRRSEGWIDEDLLLLDTHGELAGLYGAATAAFIGGSFARIGGHNPLEAAIHGLPVAWGPHVENFRDACEVLRGRGGFLVEDSGALEEFFRWCLSDEARRRFEGAGGKAAVLENRGATKRNLDLFTSLMAPR